jgi:hypothetical protein
MLSLIQLFWTIFLIFDWLSILLFFGRFLSFISVFRLWLHVRFAEFLEEELHFLCIAIRIKLLNSLIKGLVYNRMNGLIAIEFLKQITQDFLVNSFQVLKALAEQVLIIIVDFVLKLIGIVLFKKQLDDPKFAVVDEDVVEFRIFLTQVTEALCN